jgi:hypothetical protein
MATTGGGSRLLAEHGDDGRRHLRPRVVLLQAGYGDDGRSTGGRRGEEGMNGRGGARERNRQPAAGGGVDRFEEETREEGIENVGIGLVHSFGCPKIFLDRSNHTTPRGPLNGNKMGQPPSQCVRRA